MKFRTDFSKVHEVFLLILGRIFAKFTTDIGEVYDGFFRSF